MLIYWRNRLCFDVVYGNTQFHLDTINLEMIWIPIVNRNGPTPSQKIRKYFLSRPGPFWEAGQGMHRTTFNLSSFVFRWITCKLYPISGILNAPEHWCRHHRFHYFSAHQPLIDSGGVSPNVTPYIGNRNMLDISFPNLLLVVLCIFRLYTSISAPLLDRQYEVMW